MPEIIDDYDNLEWLNNEVFQEKITRRCTEQFARASFLKKLLKEWISRNIISRNIINSEQSVYDLITICEEKEKGYNSKTKKQAESIKTQIEEWFMRDIIPEELSKKLSIKELIEWLEIIIKETKDFKK
jgi:hypothetical protein